MEWWAHTHQPDTAQRPPEGVHTRREGNREVTTISGSATSGQWRHMQAAMAAMQSTRRPTG